MSINSGVKWLSISSAILFSIPFLISGQPQNYPTSVNQNLAPSPVISGSINPNATEKEEIAFRDNDDTDLQKRYFNKGDWDYRENWQYHRNAYLSGQTQDQYERRNPSRKPGIDYDDFHR
jgi:hypothetical protein